MRPAVVRGRSEAGSAVVDFVLVSVLVSVLFLAVFQVGLALYVRNTIISCASEGARFGAKADADPRAGAARTRELIDASLSARFAGDVSAEVVDAGGVQVLAVRVRAPLPVLGPFGPDSGYDLVGRAFLERQ
jgi:Flp pilus assembly protein TadG